LQDFSANTSAHGLPYIIGGGDRAGAHRTRIIWAFIFTVCLLACTNQLYQLVVKFNRNEKTVNVEVKVDFF
jgi:hypothetical protein